jgi:hypothetical protein
MTPFNTANQHHDFVFHERMNKNRINVPAKGESMKNIQSAIKSDLPLTFSGRAEVKGFLFRQIARSANGYLYEVLYKDVPIHYEVFKRIENRRFGCITYPSSKSFGRIAWTSRTYDEAMRKFETLLERSERLCQS